MFMKSLKDVVYEVQRKTGVVFEQVDMENEGMYGDFVPDHLALYDREYLDHCEEGYVGYVDGILACYVYSFVTTDGTEVYEYQIEDWDDGRTFETKNSSNPEGLKRNLIQDLKRATDELNYEDFDESHSHRGRMLKEARVDSDVAYVVCSMYDGDKWWPTIFFKDMNKDYIGSHSETISIDEMGVYSSIMNDNVIELHRVGDIKNGTYRCAPEDVEEVEEKFYDKLDEKLYTSVRFDDIKQLIDLDYLNKETRKDLER